MPIRVMPIDIPSDTPNINCEASDVISFNCVRGIRRPTNSSSKPIHTSFSDLKCWQLPNIVFIFCSLASGSCVLSISCPATSFICNAEQLSLCQSLCFSFTFYIIFDFLYIHNCLLDTVYCALDFYEILSTCGRIPADKREKECEVL